MGGAGSGNRRERENKAVVVEDCIAVDANAWTREGVLAAGIRRLGSSRLQCKAHRVILVGWEVNTLDLACPFVGLSYFWAWSGGKHLESAHCRVPLMATRQHFGGLRWWFCCPVVVGGQPCGRRVAKLYLPPKNRGFGCRACFRLTYKSCQESGQLDDLERWASEEKRLKRLLEKAKRR